MLKGVTARICCFLPFCVSDNQAASVSLPGEIVQRILQVPPDLLGGGAGEQWELS